MSDTIASAGTISAAGTVTPTGSIASAGTINSGGTISSGSTIASAGTIESPGTADTANVVTAMPVSAAAFAQTLVGTEHEVFMRLLSHRHRKTGLRTPAEWHEEIVNMGKEEAYMEAKVIPPRKLRVATALPRMLARTRFGRR